MSERTTSVPDDAGPPAAVTPAALLAAADDLYVQGVERGLTLRLIGSLAVQLVCPKWRHLAVELGRRPTGDIDFVGYAKQSPEIERLFDQAGYVMHPGIRHSQEFGVKRLIFVPPSGTPKIDVFLDDLIMAHTVSFVDRLDISAPTVSLVDLLLSKLQIHEMTRNDLIDLVILLAEHEVGEGSPAGVIDATHFARVMGADWGFHYTASLNLEWLRTAVDGFDQLPDQVAAQVRRQVGVLSQLLADTPKSTRWRFRARVGARMRWYEDVAEVD